jgi:DinB superfamily/Pentapeptide repeats (8 copies)
VADFHGSDLRRSRFERADLSGTLFRSVDLSNATFRAVDLSGVTMRSVDLVNVEIYGDIDNLTINGVDIAPLVNAELDRRFPLRVKMRPTTVAGFAEAWAILERLWGETVERARRLPPDLLHESVDDEWSFIETLRHLAFATDAWVSRAILSDPSPWDALDLPWDEMPDTPGVPRDRSVRPSLDTVLELRRERMDTVLEFIKGLTDASLGADTIPIEEPGWPPPQSFPVGQCLRIVLNEEWEHRRFAERDLEALETLGK